MVPGIDASWDKMLQGRLFSYPDTHRHRLGVNYAQIPINAPYVTRVNNQQRDGFMAVNGNGGSSPNYEPNSLNGPRELQLPGTTYSSQKVDGIIARHPMILTDDDFVQAGNLYRLMSKDAKDRLVNNIAGKLKNAKPEIRERQIKHFKRADPE